jgi:hypothetical protein
VQSVVTTVMDDFARKLAKSKTQSVKLTFPSNVPVTRYANEFERNVESAMKTGWPA